jgi:molybdenum cofactor synthesis domain-containing protein
MEPDLQQMRWEAFAFRQLVDHLQARTDVQNIDLMNLSGFCRNCLAKWYVAGAHQDGVSLTYPDGCQRVYNMPIADWKSKHQTKATPEQMEKYNATKAMHAKHTPLPSPSPTDATTTTTTKSAPGPISKPPTHPASTAPTPGALSNVCCQPVPELANTAGGVSGVCLMPGAGAERAKGPAVEYTGPPVRFGLLTVSDRAHRGEYEDLSGPAMRACLPSFATVTRQAIVPDEEEQIRKMLTKWSEGHAGGAAPCDIVFTSGGTGFSPRDVTPEATAAVLHKHAPQIMNAVLRATLPRQPMAMLSR